MQCPFCVRSMPLCVSFSFSSLGRWDRDVNARFIKNDVLGVDGHVLAVAKYRVNFFKGNAFFMKRYPPDPEHVPLLQWMSKNLDAWYATHRPPFAISHDDFRLDNILFLKKDNHRAVAVDWGGSNWALPLRDVSYFLGQWSHSRDSTQVGEAATKRIP